MIVMIVKKKKIMIVKKKKGWNFDPNTWDGKFYIPYKIDKKKILEILTS